MKERILQKANELFRRYGIKSVTMDEIAGQLGISKKTVYQIYADKDALVREVTASVIGYARDLCENSRKAARDAIHEVFQAMTMVREIFSDMNPAMIYDLEKFYPAAYRLFLEHRECYLTDIIRNNLRQGIAEGLYRPDINIEAVVLFRKEGMAMVMNQDLFPPSKYKLVDIQREFIELFLFGVATLEGYNRILKYKQEFVKS